MTPREARHAIYAAAFAIEQYVNPVYTLKNSALNALDEALDEVRIAEAAL